MARIEPVFGNMPVATEGAGGIDNAGLHEVEYPYSRPEIFAFHGRLSLTRYWLVHVPFVVLIPGALWAFFMLGLRSQPGMQILASLAIWVPVLLLQASLLMRRARDLGWSPVWGVLATILPGIGFFIMLPLVLLPGQEGSNRHDLANPPTSTLTRVATVLLIGMCLAACMAWVVFEPMYLVAVQFPQ